MLTDWLTNKQIQIKPSTDSPVSINISIKLIVTFIRLFKPLPNKQIRVY